MMTSSLARWPMPFAAAALCGCLPLSCTSASASPPSVLEPITTQTGQATPAEPAAKDTPTTPSLPSLNSPNGTTSTAATSTTTIPPSQAQSDPECLLLPSPGTTPLFLQNNGSMLTRFMSPCVTRSGHEGVRPDSQWLAMGIPCTQGPGVIRYEGDYLAAKIVTFALGTDCPMSPSQTKLQSDTITLLGLQEKSTLLAYNPLAVQYWEVVGTTDADTGFTIELRSNQGLQSLWPKLHKGEAMSVLVYGRENAWIPGDQMYRAKLDIQLVSEPRRFRVKTRELSVVTDEDFASAKQRCEALRPTRNCDAVFYKSK